MSIHFSCTQCGKCCDRSPNTNYLDMLELSDEFIFQTSHHNLMSFEKKPIEKELLEHYQRIAHSIVLPEFDACLFYWIDFISMNVPSNKTCSKLINNKCSIYSKRPLTCQLAPLDYGFSESQQWRPLEQYKLNVKKHDWKCSFEASSPIIFKDESIYQNHHNSLFYTQLETIKDFTDKYIEFLSFYGDERKNDHFKMLFSAYQKGSLMLTDLVQSLLVLMSCNIIGSELANKTIYNQVKLLEKEINSSQEFKIKENLQYIRSYKIIKQTYEKALNNKIFEYNQQESFDLIHE